MEPHLPVALFRALCACLMHVSNTVPTQAYVLEGTVEETKSETSYRYDIGDWRYEYNSVTVKIYNPYGAGFLTNSHVVSGSLDDNHKALAHTADYCNCLVISSAYGGTYTGTRTQWTSTEEVTGSYKRTGEATSLFQGNSAEAYALSSALAYSAASEDRAVALAYAMEAVWLPTMSIYASAEN